MLKAGRAYHKYKAKRNSWPKVRRQRGDGGHAWGSLSLPHVQERELFLPGTAV